MSGLGAIHPATGSDKEDIIADEKQGISPVAEDNKGPLDGPAIPKDKADQDNALQPGLKDSSAPNDKPGSGVSSATVSATPALSNASGNTIHPSQQALKAAKKARKARATALISVTTELVRKALMVPIPQRFGGILEELIEEMLAREDTAHPVGMYIIGSCRIDKLIGDLIMTPPEFLVIDPELAAARVGALSLQFKWQKRFKAAYFDLDHGRFEELMYEGALHDIAVKGPDRVLPDIWSVTRRTPIPDRNLEPGMWWLNTACLVRDGVIRNEKQIVSYHLGCFVLPLLTGTESVGREPNALVYKKKGSLDETFLSLVLSVGSRLKLFRGYKLSSIFAPEAGIRYDGEFLVKSHHYDVGVDGTHHIILFLEPRRYMPMDQLCLIPSGSQLDDWKLYSRLLKDEIIIGEGADRYYQWKHDEEQAEKERANNIEEDE